MEHTNPQEQAILKLTGEFVKHKRRALGYNTQGVARLVNLPQSAFSKIENGTYTGLKHVKLYAILECLKTTPTELDAYIRERLKNNGALRGGKNCASYLYLLSILYPMDITWANGNLESALFAL